MSRKIILDNFRRELELQSKKKDNFKKNVSNLIEFDSLLLESIRNFINSDLIFDESNILILEILKNKLIVLRDDMEYILMEPLKSKIKSSYFSESCDLYFKHLDEVEQDLNYIEYLKKQEYLNLLIFLSKNKIREIVNFLRL
jgi:hypothetical protein